MKFYFLQKIWVLLIFYSLAVTVYTTSVNISKFYTLPTMYLYVLYVSKKNSKFCPMVDVCNQDGNCLLCGTNWVFKSNKLHFILKGLKYCTLLEYSFLISISNALHYLFTEARIFPTTRTTGQSKRIQSNMVITIFVPVSMQS
jgi:hypothetical protein